jgi:hypothetical protein
MMSTLATIIKVNSPCGCRVVPDDVSEGDEIDVDARSIREDKWTCGVCHKDHFIQVVAVLLPNVVLRTRRCRSTSCD